MKGRHKKRIWVIPVLKLPNLVWKMIVKDLTMNMAFTLDRFVCKTLGFKIPSRTEEMERLARDQGRDAVVAEIRNLLLKRKVSKKWNHRMRGRLRDGTLKGEYP